MTIHLTAHDPSRSHPRSRVDLRAPISAACYSAQLTASGGTAAYSYAVVAGALPPGLTLASDGTLSGTATGTGGTFDVRATDARNCTVTKSYTLGVSCPAITLAPTTLTAATRYASYSGQLTASGGDAPYSFGVTSGATPTGVTLSSSGALSGTPTASSSSFTATATDAFSCTGARSYSLTVGCPAITIGTVSNATRGASYGATFTASGGTAPYQSRWRAGRCRPGSR